MPRILPLFLIFCLISSTFSLIGQKLDHVQGEVLVRFTKGTSHLQWQAQYNSLRQAGQQIQTDCLSEHLQVYRLRFDFAKINERNLLAKLRRDPAIASAQFNRLLQLELRDQLPNDPFFSDQYYLQNTGQLQGTAGFDIRATQAWDITTGGVTPAGDTIVICVIDNGLDLSHEDFSGNIWVNRAEIPDNGFDDDNNGYVDDYLGWNAKEGTDEIDYSNFHGTRVAGVIGAKGDNEIGISGINWNVKLMIVVGGFGETAESKVIEAYDYPLAQRKRYNASNGAEGAFVVATNSSWGLLEEFAEDYPLWCAIYDSLGHYGIINISATDNSLIDIDLFGDMPTSCPSDFLIPVTSLNARGELVAAFGFQTVDLASFGDSLFMTADGNTYSFSSGTSFATPTVTAAVGLLYAAPCPTLSALAETDPRTAALYVRRLLLESVEPATNLDGQVTTGGYLNLDRMLNLALAECTDCPPLVGIGAAGITDTEARLEWAANDSIMRVDLRWRTAVEEDWILITDVQSPYLLEDLTACTDYEFQLRAFCREETQEFEETFTFTTDGCCIPPPDIRVSNIAETQALIEWTDLLAARRYVIRFRPEGITVWDSIITPQPLIALNNLDTCTNYEFQVQTQCQNENTAFGKLIAFTTLGCSACLEADYCGVRLDTFSNAFEEWIARVQLEDLDNQSGKDGYGDYTGLESTVLYRGDSLDIALSPGYSGRTQPEYFRVWIDFNQDGFFTNQDELVFETPELVEEGVSGKIAIPETAKLGATRMRVVMRFVDPPSPCTFPVNYFGEAEDYCVEISTRTSIQSVPPLPAEVELQPNPFLDQLSVRMETREPLTDLRIDVFDIQGRPLLSRQEPGYTHGQRTLNIPVADWGAGVYIIRLGSREGQTTLRAVKMR